jgi:hypothetical protein
VSRALASTGRWPSRRGGAAAAGQRGLVLFVALVALVVLAFAAASMMRSVDTATLVAGNIADRQASVQESDRGVEAARAFLLDRAINDPNYLNSATNPTPTRALPYSSNNGGLDWDPRRHDWNQRAALLPAGAGGNEIYYVIHRMCDLDTQGTPRGNFLDAANNCMLVTANLGSDAAREEVSYGRRNFSSAATGRPVYRVTIRVLGPKNAQTFVQATLQ